VRRAALGERATAELQASIQAHFKEWLASSGHMRHGEFFLSFFFFERGLELSKVERRDKPEKCSLFSHLFPSISFRPSSTLTKKITVYDLARLEREEAGGSSSGGGGGRA
jgi:hypothetical protein